MTITVRVDNIEITYQQETDPTEFPLIYSSNTVIETIEKMVEQVIKISKEK